MKRRSGGTSEIISPRLGDSPVQGTDSPRGYTRSTGVPKTAIVLPAPFSAPSCAIASMPRASPLTTVIRFATALSQVRSRSSARKRSVLSCPTMAIEGR